MGQIPNATVVIIKDLVLSVILFHILNDQIIVDHSRADSFPVFFNLLLVFKLSLNV